MSPLRPYKRQMNISGRLSAPSVSATSSSASLSLLRSEEQAYDKKGDEARNVLHVVKYELRGIDHHKRAA